MLAPRRQDEPVRQIDAARARGDEEQSPDESGAEHAHDLRWYPRLGRRGPSPATAGGAHYVRWYTHRR